MRRKSGDRAASHIENTGRENSSRDTATRRRIDCSKLRHLRTDAHNYNGKAHQTPRNCVLGHYAARFRHRAHAARALTLSVSKMNPDAMLDRVSDAIPSSHAILLELEQKLPGVTSGLT